GSVGILLFRDAEDQHREKAEVPDLFGFLDEQVHRVVVVSRQPLDFLLDASAMNDKQRINQIVATHIAFSHHAAQRLISSEPPQSLCGKSDVILSVAV